MIIKNGVLEKVTLDDIVNGEANIPNEVKKISEYAFEGCFSLKKIKIPESVTEIESHAFHRCISLTEINIPKTVTKMGDYVFEECSSLQNIHVSEENSQYRSIDGVLFSKDSTKIIKYPEGKNGKFIIPEGVTQITNSAFYDSNRLTEIYIPGELTTIDANIFWRCSSLENINVSEENSQYRSIDGVLFSKDLTKIIKYPAGKRGKYKIPETVSQIGESAFEGCMYLTEIDIPETVKEIENDTFRDCIGLKKIKIPKDVIKIGDRVFGNCTYLTDIELPEGITQIGDSAFYACRNLKKINIPKGVTEIGYWAFKGCKRLKKVNLPEGLVKIEDELFEGCESLTEVEIPKSVTVIGEYAFAGCSNLSQIELPQELTIIGNNAFEGCKRLIEINIPDKVAKIGYDVFEDCDNLTIRINPNKEYLLFDLYSEYPSKVDKTIMFGNDLDRFYEIKSKRNFSAGNEEVMDQIFHKIIFSLGIEEFEKIINDMDVKEIQLQVMFRRSTCTIFRKI